MNDYNKNIGNRIRELRELSDITIKDIAKELGSLVMSPSGLVLKLRWFHKYVMRPSLFLVWKILCNTGFFTPCIF